MCKCCNYLQDLKNIEKEMNLPTPADIKIKWKAIIAEYTYKKGIKKPKGIIEYKSYDLKYCPMCGRKLEGK